jgi:hypothetical protein
VSNTLILNPPPVRLLPTRGGGSNWIRAGNCIVQDNNPSPQSGGGGRLTSDEYWEEGGRNWTDKLFLESQAEGAFTLEAPTIVEAVNSERKKKTYTPKNHNQKPTKIFGEWIRR